MSDLSATNKNISKHSSANGTDQSARDSGGSSVTEEELRLKLRRKRLEREEVELELEMLELRKRAKFNAR